ncbi:hypothetical protein A0257_00400 [Hymenobacter psoromatis]|nr:hypothetical protein A0257_00400 [Hymenobacter psoromatis]
MLITVRGTYENGVVRLSEPLPAAANLPAGEVLVTFLASKPECVAVAMPSKKPRFSFDEALALPTTPGSSVSDAVLEEREESP